jgi:hypothetical protein
MTYELIGTLASVMVLMSFLFTGEKRIRIVNILGAILFVVYGVLIGAFSVWFLNGALLIVHTVKLYKGRSL